MYREIIWSDESEGHIARHGISPPEVDHGVNARPIWTTPGRSGTTLVYCTTSAGRYLLVVLAEELDGTWRVVTARDMTDSERRTFSQKGR
jgi:hypothetical protein